MLKNKPSAASQMTLDAHWCADGVWRVPDVVLNHATWTTSYSFGTASIDPEITKRFAELSRQAIDEMIKTLYSMPGSPTDSHGWKTRG